MNLEKDKVSSQTCMIQPKGLVRVRFSKLESFT